MTIPASQLALVTPSVLSAGGSSLSLGGLVVSENVLIPQGQVLTFASALAVGNYFGFTSTEYNLALIYFAGITNAKLLPSSLQFVGYAATALGAWLLSGSMASVTLAMLQAFTGTLTITIDGVAATSASINLSAATSFSNAATIIQTAFTSPNFGVVWNAQLAGFQFTSTATGATTTAAYATGSLAADLNLTNATGAVLSQGAAASTPATFMPTVIALTQNFATWTTSWEPVLNDKLAFSTWNALQNNRYAFCGYDSDVNALTPDTTETWASQLITDGTGGTIPIYGNVTHAAMVMAWAAGLNFNQPNGRTDLAGIGASGVVPYVTNGNQAPILLDNGYNFYGAYATATGQFQIFEDGSVTGQFAWADSYVNQIAFNADLQTDMMVLLTSGVAEPYNAAGYAAIEAAFADSIASALAFGTIRTGITLSSEQAQQIFQIVGANVTATLYAQGWYLYIAPSSPTQRMNRTSPAMTMFYTDGGDIQALALNSVNVQ
jgi:hypothetical protein